MDFLSPRNYEIVIYKASGEVVFSSNSIYPIEIEFFYSLNVTDQAWL